MYPLSSASCTVQLFYSSTLLLSFPLTWPLSQRASLTRLVSLCLSASLAILSLSVSHHSFIAVRLLL